MLAKKLKAFLNGHKTKYVTISHSPAYTAQQIAQVAHIPAHELAKTVMVKIDGKMAMAVLPADHKVDFDKLKQAAGADKVELATETEFRHMFPDCEIGAMPPFGNLYDMKVFVAKEMAEDEEIGFNAGSHSEIVKLSYRDFDTLVKPQVAEISV